MSDALLEVRHLHKYYPVRQRWFSQAKRFVKAVDDVTFNVSRGETLGLVGESGCGKTTVGKILLHAIQPTKGEVILHSKDKALSITKSRGIARKAIQRHMQMVFQDPYGSLNPRMSVQETIEEPLICLTNLDRQARLARVEELLSLVGLAPDLRMRYPHAFSGGQRQRISIARALATTPDIIVLDEPVSALDVSVQAQIINLLLELQQRLKLSYIFISHDINTVRHVSDRIAVMYLGRIVELGRAQTVFNDPQHPYTRMLLGALPTLDYGKRPSVPRGEIPDAAKRPSGCAFHPRCPHVLPRCQTHTPVLHSAPDRHQVACHLVSDGSLSPREVPDTSNERTL